MFESDIYFKLNFEWSNSLDGKVQSRFPACEKQWHSRVRYSVVSDLAPKALQRMAPLHADSVMEQSWIAIQAHLPQLSTSTPRDKSEYESYQLLVLQFAFSPCKGFAQSCFLLGNSFCLSFVGFSLESATNVDSNQSRPAKGLQKAS